MRCSISPALPRRALSAAIATAALICAFPLAARACTPTSTATTPVFSQFGDWNPYALAPGGSFESGTSGWTLGGSAVKSGNDSYRIGAGGSRALWVMPGTTPVSAPFCVGADQPSFRFVARQASGGWAEMNVDVLWTDTNGTSHVSTAGGLSPTTSWAPSQAYGLGQMLPTQEGRTYVVRLRFVPASGGGAITVDDLYVDPYNRG